MDDDEIAELGKVLASVNTNSDKALTGFDLGLVGYDCANEIEPDTPWSCPFTPGCGAKRPADCPLAKQRAAISYTPARTQ
jgi:hypothetical protein